MCEKELKTALDGVVEDAVAVVGADLNVASETLLRSVAVYSAVEVVGASDKF